MIEARHLTKRYGKAVAVDGVSFAVRPGRVTGFLGPNGVGKSTTMRLILGLDTPSAGSVVVNGKPYGQLADPLRSVGALLDAKAIVGGRSAASHLNWLAPGRLTPATGNPDPSFTDPQARGHRPTPAVARITTSIPTCGDASSPHSLLAFDQTREGSQRQGGDPCSQATAEGRAG